MRSVAYEQHPVVDAGGGAEPGPGVAHAPEVELHREGVHPHGDGAVLDEPLGDLGLVCWHLHPARHLDSHAAGVKLASFVMPVIRIVILFLKTPYVKEGLVSILHET